MNAGCLVDTWGSIRSGRISKTRWIRSKVCLRLSALPRIHQVLLTLVQTINWEKWNEIEGIRSAIGIWFSFNESINQIGWWKIDTDDKRWVHAFCAKQVRRFGQVRIRTSALNYWLPMGTRLRFKDEFSSELRLFTCPNVMSCSLIRGIKTFGR